MDVLTTGLLACAGALAVSASVAFGRELWHPASRRQQLRALRAELEAAAAAYVPKRIRHNHHCVTCGRFAKRLAGGPRRDVLVCKAHGRHYRSHRLVGDFEQRPAVTLMPTSDPITLSVVTGSIEIVPLEQEITYTELPELLQATTELVAILGPGILPESRGAVA